MILRATLGALATLLAATSTTAQERLVLEERPVGDTAEYYSAVRDVLREAFERDVELNVVVQQSFDVEFAVGLRRRRGKYEIFSVHPSRQVFTYTFIKLMKQGLEGASTGQRRKIEAEIKKREASLPTTPSQLPLSRCAVAVDRPLAATLMQTWQGAVENTQAKGQRVGMDGTTYHFSMRRSGKQLSGQVWSPSPTSQTGRLARVAELMREYCMAKHSKDLHSLVKAANEAWRGAAHAEADGAH